MKSVTLVWTPSVSTGVEEQNVRVFNTATLAVYGEQSLGAGVNQFTAMVPEGTTVQGSVTTLRDVETVTALSNTVDVGFGPLVGATDVGLSLSVAVQPIA